MKTATKKKAAHITKDGYAYLTKRTTIAKAHGAGKKAATKAMVDMGFVVTAENGWVIKKYADGSKEKITQI